MTLLILIAHRTDYYVRSAILHNPLSLKIKIPRIPSIAVPNILTSPTIPYILPVYGPTNN